MFCFVECLIKQERSAKAKMIPLQAIAVTVLQDDTHRQRQG